MSAIFSSVHGQVSASRGGGRILDIGSSYGHFLSQFDSSNGRPPGLTPPPMPSLTVANSIRTLQRTPPTLKIFAWSPAVLT